MIPQANKSIRIDQAPQGAPQMVPCYRRAKRSPDGHLEQPTAKLCIHVETAKKKS